MTTSGRPGLPTDWQGLRGAACVQEQECRALCTNSCSKIETGAGSPARSQTKKNKNFHGSELYKTGLVGILAAGGGGTIFSARRKKDMTIAARIPKRVAAGRKEVQRARFIGDYK
mmetsp:Transcript_7688/g.17214  ORF Transcript_7688/g.17214 Transcript_7688/m.17214 type:complete len:115 (+) Transcript_7688:188-532(+)